MITDSIINKKQYDRAMRMRDGDEETTIDALKDVVATSMIAQTSRSKKMVQRSLEEVNQVARDIVNGQIKMDETRKKKFVGRLKNLSDDMKDQMEKGDFEKKTEKVTKGLKDVLPSPSTLMSAVMTANPMLGFALRTGGAVKGAMGAAKSSMTNPDDVEQIEAKKRNIDDDFNIVEDESGGSNNNTMVTPFDSEKTVNVLMGIEREMITLRQIWDDNDETQDDIKSTLESMKETDEDQLKEARLQRERAATQATEDRREAKRVDKSGNIVNTTSGGDDEDVDSMLDDLLGGFAGGGLMGGLMAAFNVLKSVAKGGMKFLRFAGKATIIGSAIIAIYDFVEGFFGAADILDKNEGDLTVKDRIAAGMGSIITGFLNTINTITSWFGLDFMSWFDGDPKKIISKGINDGIDSIMDGFKSVIGRWKSIFTNIFSLFGQKELDTTVLMNTLSDIGKDLLAIPVGWANSLLSAFGIVDKKDDEQVDQAVDKALGFISDSIGKAMDWMLDILNFDFDFSSIAKDVKEKVSGVIEDIKNFASNAISDAWESTLAFFGYDKDDKDTDGEEEPFQTRDDMARASAEKAAARQESNESDETPVPQQSAVDNSTFSGGFVPSPVVNNGSQPVRVPNNEQTATVDDNESQPVRTRDDVARSRARSARRARQRQQRQPQAVSNDSSLPPAIGMFFEEYTRQNSIEQSVISTDDYLDSGTTTGDESNSNNSNTEIKSNSVFFMSQDDFMASFEGIIKGDHTVSELKNVETEERIKEKENNNTQDNGGNAPIVNAPNTVSNVTNTTLQATDNSSNRDFSFNRASYVNYRLSYE